jgi:hypothetical protein
MPDDLAALRQQLAQLQSAVDQIAHDQQIQFTRIAQIQADLDLVREYGANSKPHRTFHIQGQTGGSGRHAQRADDSPATSVSSNASKVRPLAAPTTYRSWRRPKASRRIPTRNCRAARVRLGLSPRLASRSIQS